MTIRAMPVEAAGPATGDRPRVLRALLPIMGVVFVAFLVIGGAIPVLPLHVHEDLCFGPFMVGLVTGSQFAALVARVWAGRAADERGAKRAILAGLAAAAGAGLLYLLSLAFRGAPQASVAVLLAGRGLLGGAKSFIIAGATTWGLARAGAGNAGKVIAWTRTAMFAAFAGGAPLGTMLDGHGGFAAVAAATVLAPLVTLALIAPVRAAEPAHRGGAGIVAVARLIWLPGLSAAFSSVGFGALVTFSSLLFVARGWQPVWLAFTAYAAALIVARVLLGHLPDRIGGAKVALVSVAIEAAGSALMGMDSTVTVAATGAALTGLGYALSLPGLRRRGRPPVSPGQPRHRHGCYTACLDLALGISGPGLGLAAGHAGLGAVFLVSAVLVLLAVAVGLPLLRTGPPR